MKVDELYKQAIESRKNALNLLKEQQEVMKQRMETLKKAALGGLFAMLVTGGAISIETNIGNKNFSPSVVETHKTSLKIDSKTANEVKNAFQNPNKKAIENIKYVSNEIKNKFN